MWEMTPKDLLKQKDNCMRLYGYQLPALLKAHRKETGETQKEFASRVGVHMLTVFNWEAGKQTPRACQAEALSSALTLHPVVLGDMLAVNKMEKQFDTAYSRFQRAMTYAMGNTLLRIEQISEAVSVSYFKSNDYRSDLCRAFYGISKQDVHDMENADYRDFNVSILQLYDCYVFAHKFGIRRVETFLKEKDDTIFDTVLACEDPIDVVKSQLKEAERKYCNSLPRMLAEYVKVNNIKYSALASKVGVTEATAARWVRGIMTPKARYAKGLSEALGVHQLAYAIIRNNLTYCSREDAMQYLLGILSHSVGVSIIDITKLYGDVHLDLSIIYKTSLDFYNKAFGITANDVMMLLNLPPENLDYSVERLFDLHKHLLTFIENS